MTTTCPAVPARLYRQGAQPEPHCALANQSLLGTPDMTVPLTEHRRATTGIVAA
jgi:hypothetical protein